MIQSERQQLHRIKQEIAKRIFTCLAHAGCGRAYKLKDNIQLFDYTGGYLFSDEDKKTASGVYLLKGNTNTSKGNRHKVNAVLLGELMYNKNNSYVNEYKRNLTSTKEIKKTLEFSAKTGNDLEINQEVSEELTETTEQKSIREYGFSQEIKVTAGVAGAEINGGATALFEVTAGFNQKLGSEDTKTTNSTKTEKTTVIYTLPAGKELEVDIYTVEKTIEKTIVVNGAVDFEIKLNLENWASAELWMQKGGFKHKKEFSFTSIDDLVATFKGFNRKFPNFMNHYTNNWSFKQAVDNLAKESYRQANFELVTVYRSENGLAYELYERGINE